VIPVVPGIYQYSVAGEIIKEEKKLIILTLQECPMLILLMNSFCEGE